MPSGSHRRGAVYAGIATICLGATSASAQTCTAYVSGAHHLDFAGQWGATDTGVITDRFVVPVDRSGKPMDVQHGVDLSGYNTGIDYRRLAACGTRFAFVRLERPMQPGERRRRGPPPLFREHVAGLKSAGIGVIPTYDFQRDSHYRSVATLLAYKGKLDELENSPLMDDARAYGRQLAHQFLDLLTSAQIPQVGDFTVGPLSSRFFGVDVEEDNASINAAGLQHEFGMIYAATIVSFAIEVQKTDPKLVPVLYTSLNTYSTYLSDKLSRQDDLALSTYPGWVVRELPDARDPYPVVAGTKTDRQAQRFCIVAGGDRCIFQQYSHRALIGYGGSLPYGKPIPPAPPHHDIDRLFKLKTCTIGVGMVLVRDDAERSRCI